MKKESVKVWNKYLQKYADKYMLKREPETFVWRINCKYGEVEVFSIKNNILIYYGDYLTKSKKSHFLRRIKESYGGLVHIRQEGDTEVTLTFNESKIPELEQILQIRKKRRISPKLRADLIKRLRKE